MPSARNIALNKINKCVWPSGPYILGGEDREQTNIYQTAMCSMEKREQAERKAVPRWWERVEIT